MSSFRSLFTGFLIVGLFSFRLVEFHHFGMNGEDEKIERFH